MRYVFALVPFLIFFADYFLITKVVSKGDKETLGIKFNDVLGIVLSCLIVVVRLVENPQMPWLDVVILSYISGFLMFMAFTDSKMKKIYSLFNWITMVIGAICIVIWFLSGVTKFQVEQKLIATMGVLVFLLFARLLKLYGSGDGKIILAATILLFASSTLITYMGILIGISIGMIFVILRKIFDYIFRKDKGRKIALVPGISCGLLAAILLGL